MTTCKITVEKYDKQPSQFWYKDIGERCGIYKPVDNRYDYLRLIVQQFSTYWINISTNAIYTLKAKDYVPDQFTTGPLVETDEKITIVFDKA